MAGGRRCSSDVFFPADFFLMRRGTGPALEDGMNEADMIFVEDRSILIYSSTLLLGRDLGSGLW
ncbi:MAG TPA: hypothetical protein PKK36_07350, partial [Kiritimatiellia bacterium]|nr:hypothetical protein [Kiritimatiellia bacterium]